MPQAPGAGRARAVPLAGPGVFRAGRGGVFWWLGVVDDGYRRNELQELRCEHGNRVGSGAARGVTFRNSCDISEIAATLATWRTSENSAQHAGAAPARARPAWSKTMQIFGVPPLRASQLRRPAQHAVARRRPEPIYRHGLALLASCGQG
jgi:hypothetical protein